MRGSRRWSAGGVGAPLAVMTMALALLGCAQGTGSVSSPATASGPGASGPGGSSSGAAGSTTGVQGGGGSTCGSDPTAIIRSAIKAQLSQPSYEVQTTVQDPTGGSTQFLLDYQSPDRVHSTI